MGLEGNIRLATENDLPRISEIHFNGQKITYKGIVDDKELEELSFGDVYDYWVRELSSPRDIIIVYEKKQVEGFACIKLFRDKINRGVLDVLYVKTESQGNGIGKELFKYSAKILAENGISQMEIYTIEGNNKAKDFYMNMGACFSGCKYVNGNNGITVKNRFLISDISDRFGYTIAKKNKSRIKDILYKLNSDKKDYALYSVQDWGRLFLERYAWIKLPKYLFETDKKYVGKTIINIPIELPKSYDAAVFVTTPYEKESIKHLESLGYKEIYSFYPWEEED